MTTKNYNSVGVIAKLQIVNSIEEFDLAAKREGAALESAIDNVIYRISLAEFRSKLAEKVSEYTKEEIESEEVKNKEGKVKLDKDGDPVIRQTETEQDFIKRVQALGKITPEKLQELADLVSPTIVFDPSERERKAPVAKKISKRFLEMAQKIIAGGHVVKAAHNLAIALNVPHIDHDEESIAKAIKAKVEQDEAAQLLKLTA